jgi:hypothetical protein
MIPPLFLQGAALFAFIPVVLWLFLRQPIGPGWSVAVGLAIMFGHRFVAGPWARRHSLERCLWCGREGPPEVEISVSSPGAAWSMAACGPKHLDLCGRFLTFVARARPLIAAGIFVPLALLVAGALAEAAGRPFISHERNVLIFRTVVATTVVGTSLAYRSIRAAGGALSSAFPLHNLFLLGIGKTLWVFRIVGVWWLATSAPAILRLMS